MKLPTFITLLWSLLLSIGATYACDLGTSILWKYDQKSGRLEALKKKKTKVCHFIKDQKPNNIRIRYFKNNKEVFVHHIFWDSFVSLESFEKEKISGKKVKTKDYKVLKIPVGILDFDSYEVYHHLEKKLLGKGSL